MIKKTSVTYVIFPEKPYKRTEFPSKTTFTASTSYGITYSLFTSWIIKVQLIIQVC